VECDLLVESGRIVVAGCTDYVPDAARIDVQPGNHRMRVSYAALGDVSDDGLSGSDHYRVQLWRDTPAGLHVLKQLVASHN
jgi:hypothetical protein